ncbi:cobyric acid synthase [Sneathiella aquimaris]|uniref:cobyric acid synthase n=1 Tax=Sneathiella aquimaris TaxID=2599305 RepID=UPI00146F047F|nr:cobyric acid synthase [Sneathiella aquimaris]
MTAVIMLQGTGSDVGKSILVAGLCRALKNRGYSVRPFKPQNMSNNAAVTPEGGEIGRAQQLQALACGAPSSVHMNPVLLKPQDGKSQVIVQGQVSGTGGMSYFKEKKTDLLGKILESFETLKQQADFIVVEGAGSPAEVNLRSGDIANMGFATTANVPVILVGDINRGGVIASVVGTHNLLPENEQSLIKGYLINKFRGDTRLFDDALTLMTDLTGWHNMGIVPFIREVGDLPAEDGMALDGKQGHTRSSNLLIVVPRLAHIANFDDLDPLQSEEDVDVVFVQPGTPLPGDADLVILPGSKTTLADLHDFRQQGWDIDLTAHIRRGGKVLGLCGGYQMLGTLLSDPDGIEGAKETISGLGLLGLETTLCASKTVKLTDVSDVVLGCQTSGYEIHLGDTRVVDPALVPWLLDDDRPIGYMSENRQIAGTYLHGLFTDNAFRQKFLNRFRQKDGSYSDYSSKIEKALDTLAQELENCVDIDAIIRIAKEADQ